MTGDWPGCRKSIGSNPMMHGVAEPDALVKMSACSISHCSQAKEVEWFGGGGGFVGHD
jgi:hypothetical protein